MCRTLRGLGTRKLGLFYNFFLQTLENDIALVYGQSEKSTSPGGVMMVK